MALYQVLRSYPAPYKTTQGVTVELPAHRAAPLVKSGYLRPLEESVVAGLLPADFPALKHLRAAGLETFESLAGYDEAALVALPGIGSASAKKVLEALKQ